MWRNIDECYGKPHLGAYYATGSVDSNRLKEGAICVCCGRPATNSHHVAPKSRGHFFELHGKIMRTALFAVCGSGTTGCHNGFHGGGRFRALWVWDDRRWESDWWSGRLFDQGIEPHDPLLFEYGRWELYDMTEGGIHVVRKEFECF